MDKKILFVCTGNTCRSPMAEAIFKELANSHVELSGNVTASSAGVYAFEGDPASFEARHVMKEEFGIDISSHRAHVLDQDDIKDSCLILTMTRHQRNMILDIYPEASDKVFELKEFAYGGMEDPDITDPFGYDLEVYKKCAYEIKAAISKILDKI